MHAHRVRVGQMMVAVPVRGGEDPSRARPRRGRADRGRRRAARRARASRSSANPWLFGGTTRTSRSRYRPLSGGPMSAECAARSSTVDGGALRAEAGGVALADRSAVERARPIGRELLQRRAERRLPEQRSSWERRAVLEEHLRHAGVGGEQRLAFPHRAGERPGDRDAAEGERDRGAERLGPRQRGTFRVQRRPAADRARHGDGVGALLGHDRAVSGAEGVGVDGRRPPARWRSARSSRRRGAAPARTGRLPTPQLCG